MMKAHSFVFPRQVIGLLNIPEPDVPDLSRLHQQYIDSEGQLEPTDLNYLNDVEVSRWLRAHVDEWLKTGLNRDGSESPWSRKLLRTEHAKWVALGYLEKHPPLTEYNWINEEWSITVGETPKDESTHWASFFEVTKSEADRLFTGLVVSDWKNLLCKCRHPPCGRYFLLKGPKNPASRQRRQPAIQPYKYGTLCEVHQQSWSAICATRHTRQREKSELVDLAAEELHKMGIRGPEWQEDTRKKTQLANGVSRRWLDRHLQPVTVKWVTRNREKIERRRKKRFL